MPSKTRKLHKKNNLYPHNFAKKGTDIKCRMKTCRAKKYQAIYGATSGGNIRSIRQLYF